MQKQHPARTPQPSCPPEALLRRLQNYNSPGTQEAVASEALLLRSVHLQSLLTNVWLQHGHKHRPAPTPAILRASLLKLGYQLAIAGFRHDLDKPSPLFHTPILQRCITCPEMLLKP